MLPTLCNAHNIGELTSFTIADTALAAQRNVFSPLQSVLHRLKMNLKRRRLQFFSEPLLDQTEQMENSVFLR